MGSNPNKTESLNFNTRCNWKKKQKKKQVYVALYIVASVFDMNLFKCDTNIEKYTPNKALIFLKHFSYTQSQC